MYKKFFGLAVNPFNVTPDPRFLTLNAQTKRALACLMYGIQKRQGFVLLTGEVGTGKTTLLNVVLEWLHQNNVPIAFLFNPRLQVEEFIESILNDFGVPFQSREKGHMIARLNTWLLERYRAGQTATLIIDEAQNLSLDLLEEIRLLTNLETSTEKLLQIVMSGQPEFEQTIREDNLRQLRQRITLRCKTLPLSEDETDAYIMQRIKIASGDGSAIFTPQALHVAYLMSRGVPRVINLLCETALIDAFADQVKPISAKIVTAAAQELDLNAASQVEPLATSAPAAPASVEEQEERGEALSKIFEAIKKAEQISGRQVPINSEQRSTPPTNAAAELVSMIGYPSTPLPASSETSAIITAPAPPVKQCWLDQLPQNTWATNWAPLLSFDGKEFFTGVEEFRRLRTRLYRMREQKALRSIVITSTLAEEGKSFVASNLAQTLAQHQDKNVLLIDCDLRKAGLSAEVGARPSPGMADYLNGYQTLQAVVQRSPMEKLFFIAAGAKAANAAELVTGGHIAQLLQEAAEDFEWIIIDTPPVAPVSDAVSIASHCDGVLLVVRWGAVPRALAQRARTELRNLNLLGVVLNRVKQSDKTNQYLAYQQYGTERLTAAPRTASAS